MGRSAGACQPHGYPDSFYRFAKLIPTLTGPESFGGRAEDSFDVIVPDLPGYGFSGEPPKDGTIFRIGDMWVRLMTEKLGYGRFGAHGGDWGSTVAEQLARDHSDIVAAIHLTDVPFGHIFQKPDDLYLSIFPHARRLDELRSKRCRSLARGQDSHYRDRA